jgi:hypothetical protein
MLQRLLNQVVSGPMAKQKRVLTENVAPDRAQALAREASKTRAGRDGLTRVQNNRPIRGTETQARQWNRFMP